MRPFAVKMKLSSPRSFSDGTEETQLASIPRRSPVHTITRTSLAQKKGGSAPAEDGDKAAPAAEEELDEIDRSLKELGLEPVPRIPSSKCARGADQHIVLHTMRSNRQRPLSLRAGIIGLATSHRSVCCLHRDASTCGANDAPLLGVDVKFLKADDELKRMFGAAVRRAIPTRAPPPRGADRPRWRNSWYPTTTL